MRSLTSLLRKKNLQKGSNSDGDRFTSMAYERMVVCKGEPFANVLKSPHFRYHDFHNVQLLNSTLLTFLNIHLSILRSAQVLRMSHC